MGVEDKFNINLNQNLWALVVAFLALGTADHYHLSWWFLWLARALSTLMTASVVIGFLFYTIHYCAKKHEETKTIGRKENLPGVSDRGSKPSQEPLETERTV